MSVPDVSSPLYIGIDGGGTKCRALIVTAEGEILGVGLGGPANPFHGVAEAKSSIMQAVDLAVLEAAAKHPHIAADQLVAGMGLAGVNVPSLFEEMNKWEHPFKKMYLTTDLHIACLGAHQSDNGAVIISGTGSCGYAYVNGSSLSLGGHGFPHGDEGSGGWVGLQVVKSVLLAYDGLGPKTCLTELVRENLHAEGIMIVEKLGAAKAADYAQLAFLALQAAQEGDAVAVAILKEGANYLNAMAERLWQTNPGRMCMIGGFSEPMTAWLAPSIVKQLSAPISQPEFGAIYFAKQQEKLQA